MNGCVARGYRQASQRCDATHLGVEVHIAITRVDGQVEGAVQRAGEGHIAGRGRCRDGHTGTQRDRTIKGHTARGRRDVAVQRGRASVGLRTRCCDRLQGNRATVDGQRGQRRAGARVGQTDRTRAGIDGQRLRTVDATRVGEVQRRIVGVDRGSTGQGNGAGHTCHVERVQGHGAVQAHGARVLERERGAADGIQGRGACAVGQRGRRLRGQCAIDSDRRIRGRVRAVGLDRTRGEDLCAGRRYIGAEARVGRTGDGKAGQHRTAAHSPLQVGAARTRVQRQRLGAIGSAGHGDVACARTRV